MGFNLNNYVGGDFLSVEDINNVSQTYIVINVKEVEFEGKKKLELELGFNDVHKVFTLNATNSKALISCFGTDSDNLLSKFIVLKIVETQFKKEVVNGIRIDVDKTKTHPRNMIVETV